MVAVVLVWALVGAVVWMLVVVVMAHVVVLAQNLKNKYNIRILYPTVCRILSLSFVLQKNLIKGERL